MTEEELLLQKKRLELEKEMAEADEEESEHHSKYNNQKNQKSAVSKLLD